MDYAFYKTGPKHYLLFFKPGQADVITACFSEYSRRVLNRGRSRRVPIREQLDRTMERVRAQSRQQERGKEVVHEER